MQLAKFNQPERFFDPDWRLFKPYSFPSKFGLRGAGVFRVCPFIETLIELEIDYEEI